jgi:squalene-associated FAD-dependent desaturase
MQADVVIIGAGLAGLACAVALRESGLRVLIFESADSPGGRARSWTDARTGDSIDLGPHIVLTEHRNFLALLELLGSRDRIVWERDRLIRLREGARVTDMRLHALPAPLHLLPSFARVRSLSWRDILSNRRALWMALQLGEQQVRSLDELSGIDLLRRVGVSERFLEWFWASASISVLNVPLERCSAGALLRVFSQLAGLQQYAIGFADVGLAELFHPAAVRLIEQAGGRLHCRSRVARIDCGGERFRAIALESGDTVQADICVAAVPPQSLAELLPPQALRTQAFDDVTAFEPSPYVSTYLWFDRKLTREKFWARVWDPKGLNTDFYDLSNIRQGWGDRESVIASNAIYSHRAHHLSDEEIVATTVEEIREAVPGVDRSHVRHAVVNRIPMAIPCPTPGSEQRRPPTQTAIAGLLLAGDWTRTELPASMESAVHSGWSAAQEIWRLSGRPRRLVLPKRAPQGLAGFVYRHARS